MSYSSPPAPTPPHIRPRRPTREVPPLPLVTGSDEPLIDDDGDEQASSSSIQQNTIQSPPATGLTPLRAHYLKKTLVQLQFRHEIDAITTHSPTNSNNLSFLGPPFSPPRRDADPYLDLPFLRFTFRQFVLTFPFMAAAPKDFYSDKLQPFVSSVLSRNLSPTSVLDDDDTGDANSEQATRKKLLAKVERNMAMFLGSAIKLFEPEQVVRLNQSDLDRLELLAKKRIAKASKATRIVFEVNVIGVKTVVDKGRMRSRVHEEFIVRTRRSNFPDVFVSRRYGDFRTLANELQKFHSNEQIRPPPPKDRTAVTSTPMASPSPTSNYLYDLDSYSDIGLPQSPSQTGLATSRLAREKNRLTLRAYLHSLLASSAIASSPVLKSFLLSGPINLTQTEIEDAHRREEADRVREDGRKRFAKEIAGRVESLREAVKSVKGDIMGKDGLTHIFATIKVTPDVRDLPSNYRAVLEWARISLASTVFHQFVASDNSSETFASLKRIHGLMPYFMLKTVLRISNPIAMIRGVLDLFLAQPFGGRSLLQRMFTSSLTEEVKALENEIEAVKNKVDDPIMCAKVRQFVYAPREIQEMYKVDAAAENMHLLTIVLRAPDEPILSRMQMHRLAKAHRAHQIYLKHRASLADSDDDDGPQDEDAWLLEDLKVLTHLYSKLRDREQLIALIFEGSTADLLKDMITIFYSPLAQVYRAASIADSLSDLQNFINDLIKTVEQVEEFSQEDPHRTVQGFIDLIQRHEQSFYHFVHKVHSKGESLFNHLMQWIELFLTVVREGVGSPISLEFLLPHGGKSREDVLAEVDKVALYHYRLKVAYEAKIRRRFGRMQTSQGDVDVEDETTQELVNGVVGEIDFGELVKGDADDLAAEETDDSSSDGFDESSEFESPGESTGDDSGSDYNDKRLLNNAHSHRTLTPSRSQTFKAGQTLTHSPHAPDPSPRKRSLSLRSTKSLILHRNRDLPPAPPPPMPKSATIDLSSKPLPSSPPSRSSNESSISLTTASKNPAFPSHINQKQHSSSKLGHDSSPKPGDDTSSSRSYDSIRKVKRKKAKHSLKPPELHSIPQLLPVFVEMMRPLLRPREQFSTISSEVS